MQRCLGCMRVYEDTLTVCPHCKYVRGSAAKQTNYLAPGTVLQSRYLLGKSLGQGGFGITYIAWDTRMERALAIKEYMPGTVASRSQDRKTVSCYSEDAQQQFQIGLQKVLKESRTLAKLAEIDGVVKVLDCFEENGTAYIILELLRGETVDAILKREQRLPFDRAMAIITPVLHTLSEIHRIGLVHRDIAPDNIFVCENGKVKLLDFGAARFAMASDNKTLSVILKQGFAPVEQYSTHGSQGPFTDVYAAAATLYKMLTGVTPPTSIDRMSGEALEPIAQYAHVPAAVQLAIERAMATDAGMRTQSAEAFLAELNGADPQQTLWLPRQTVTPQPEIATTVQLPRSVEPPVRAEKPRSGFQKKLPWIIAAAAVVVAVAVIFAVRSGSTPDVTTVATQQASTVSQTSTTQTTTTTTAPTTHRVDPANEIPVASVSCSSDQGAGKYGRNYHADNVVDGNFNTCWMAAGQYAGSGTWIQLNFNGIQKVSGIKLLNGNGWDGYYNGEKVESGLYDLNGRICDFTLEFSDGSRLHYSAADVREESYGANFFVFDRPVDTSYVKLYVDSGYPGSKWTTVVCLSEFAAF